jgi:putative DNA primase/helicase
MSSSDAIHEFIHAMEAMGVKPVEPIAQRLSSGELIRFRCDGDGKGRLNGWAILYLDERPAGAFGNYRLGVDQKWKSGADFTPLSQGEREALHREWADAKAKRQAERERSEQEAALEAKEMWNAALPASELHPYAIKKRLGVAALRQHGDKLLIPMYDAAGKLWNLQRIAPDGTKRFLRGGRCDGLFCLVAYAVAEPATWCLGEGYSTMDAVHRSSGYPCIVAFSSKNMLAVARTWNNARPDLNYIVCADDDPHLVDHPQIRKNLGVVTATAVAEEIGARLALPRLIGSSSAEAA